jgi:CheY-like chemotaxis protein
MSIPVKRIMVVDDDPFVRQSIELMLEVDGHQIETAANGEQALALFEVGKFDVILTDYEMPIMRGDRLAAEIKSLSPSQAIGMVTGYAETLQSSCGSLPGVDLLLLKPFSLDSLRQAVTQLLTKPQACQSDSVGPVQQNRAERLVATWSGPQ